MRSINAVTPDFSAARASRRVAVKSSARGSPHNVITTMPSAGQRKPSPAARSTLAASGKTPMITREGSIPIALSPGMYSAPVCLQQASSLSQSTSPPITLVRIAAKPVPLLASFRSTRNSCSCPRIIPPPRA